MVAASQALNENLRPPLVMGARLKPYLRPLLALLVLLVFGRVLGHEFVSYDDGLYIHQNEHVLGGLTPGGISWAFTTFHGSTWIPVTWLSHMLDATLFGASPAGHHLMNLVWHALAALTCFLALERMTGDTWTSIAATALFALHPLRVESVAWASERKDVLSGFFFFLALWLYAGWVERPSPRRYMQLAAATALGLMSKQMLVTLPFVLLLLDVWPLGRTRLARAARSLPEEQAAARRRPGSRLVLEKLPLMALCALAAWIGWLSQQSGVHADMQSLPLHARAANAATATATYLRQTLTGTGLSILYPHPGLGYSAAAVWGAAGVLGLLTVLVLAVFRRTPAPAVGWLWFLGMLVPVLGLVQFGITHAHADRFTYLPHAGLFMGLAFGVRSLARRRPAAARPAAVLALAWLAYLGGRSVVQAGHWHDTVALWTHALEVVPDNAVAHYNLGRHYLDQGQVVRAREHLREAVRIQDDFGKAWMNLGILLAREGRGPEAEPILARAAELLPQSFEAQANLGSLLFQAGRAAEAAPYLRRAWELEPSQLVLRAQLARALAASGSHAAAAGHLRALLAQAPESAELRYELGSVLALMGQWPEAIRTLRDAVSLKPGWIDALIALASAQTDARRFAPAAKTWERIVGMRPEALRLRLEYGRALGQAGEAVGARTVLEDLRAKASQKGDRELVARVEEALAGLPR